MSFNIALSGIQAINEQLESVSHNIANAGTYGFKSSRANFSSVYAGEQANGVQIGSVTQNIGRNGSAIGTGRGLDASIQGRGFFVGRDSQGVLSYTRVGIFEPSKDGYLIDASGRRAQGYGPTVNGVQGPMGDIRIPTGQIPAVASTRVSYVGNLSADWTAPALPFDPANANTYNMVKQSVVYDALGGEHTVSQYFVKAAAPANTVTVHYAFDGGAPLAATRNLSFGANGQLPAGIPTTPLTLTPTNGAGPINFAIDYTGTTQFAGEANTTTNRPDGYPSGSFLGVDLAADGSVVAKYSNDQRQIVGTLALATFASEGNLTSINDTSWVANNSSGDPLYTTPGVGLGGKLATSSLEGSNVDITAELVGLMTSQRNYQANSKVITAENQMMQALMQAL
ncbi:flagellar hook protein FlgE [Massilia niastensis]|uniref:flagellar hook protein FlgE n=1 Tax=Massilia niastensis TaxID=544911 RepID=UPI00037DF21B|nr:flagellar hook-basal body complex protein [Massilia niastensis]